MNALEVDGRDARQAGAQQKDPAARDPGRSHRRHIGQLVKEVETGDCFEPVALEQPLFR